MLGHLALAEAIDLPRTGQVTCYDSTGNMIACEGTGQDGDILAGVEWPNPRFTITYCEASGPCEDQSADCDGDPGTDVVTDNLTGLMWTGKAKSDGAVALYWPDAVSYANSLNRCGYDDWRLANANEIESVVHAGGADLGGWLADRGFVDVQTNFYWSSTTFPYDQGYNNYPHYGVGMHQGDGAERLERMCGWCLVAPWSVRSGQEGTPDSTYPPMSGKPGRRRCPRRGTTGICKREYLGRTRGSA